MDFPISDMLNKKLRIAVWHNLPSGGGKRQMYSHVKGLLERGHHVEVWCPFSVDQSFLPLRNIVLEHRVPLELPGHERKILGPSRHIRKIARALEKHSGLCAKEMSRGKFDVLLSGSCMYFCTSSIAQYVSFPTVLYLNEPYRRLYEAMPELPWVAPRWNGRMNLGTLHLRLKNRFLLESVRLQAKIELGYARQFDTILTNSLFSRESILRAYNIESSVCYLGIDIDHYKPSGRQKKNFVIGMGTIYFGKGIDRAIRTIATISKECRPDLIWIANFAHDQCLREYCDLARNLEVNFIPKINISDKEVIDFCSAALAMIYTSRLEPFGYAPLEANACGTPVVGIAEGGVRETIIDGVNGFLSQEYDPVLLGSFILRFISNPSLSLSMGDTARKYVEQTWNSEFGITNIENALYKAVKQKQTI